MNWFSKKSKPPPEKHEIGCCEVTIEMVDGEKHKRLFFGEACSGVFGEDCPLIISASFRFDQWMDRNGKTGFVAVGKGYYVPASSVKAIMPAFSSHLAEAKP